MLANHNREKLINAIIYFCEKSAPCGKTKLFKLLYFLDFEHYQQTGRSVTGLDYYAWPMGPVPVSLTNELKSPAPDFVEKLEIEAVTTKRENSMQMFIAKAPFDPSHFTKRELRLLADLVDRYDLKRADEMVEFTHLPTLPWHKVFEQERRPQALIPYEYALSDEDKEAILSLSAENQELLQNYK